MTADPIELHAARVRAAIEELQGRILERHPEATFSIVSGEEDPSNVHMWTAIDADDPFEVIDFLADRLLELQVDEHLPVYVIPIRATVSV